MNQSQFEECSFEHRQMLRRQEKKLVDEEIEAKVVEPFTGSHMCFRFVDWFFDKILSGLNYICAYKPEEDDLHIPCYSAMSFAGPASDDKTRERKKAYFALLDSLAEIGEAQHDLRKHIYYTSGANNLAANKDLMELDARHREAVAKEREMSRQLVTFWNIWKP